MAAVALSAGHPVTVSPGRFRRTAPEDRIRTDGPSKLRGHHRGGRVLRPFQSVSIVGGAREPWPA
jgi:hypothetical protein